MEYECRFRVRTYELDANGHVNNAVYLNYLEYARGEYLKGVKFDYGAAVEAGYGLYVTRISIDYKSPAFLDDELVITTRVIKKGAVSGTLGQVVRRGDVVLAVAEVGWAFVDSSGRPTRIPPQWNVPGLAPDSETT